MTIENTRHAPDCGLAPHRHGEGYIAVVVAGAYEEASVDGRYFCPPATLVWHPPFHLHENRFGADGAAVLNLPLPAAAPVLNAYRVCLSPCAENIIALAQTDAARAAFAALEELQAKVAPAMAAPDWLISMARALRRDPYKGVSSSIGVLARESGVSAEHASRQFKAYFGVTPTAYRREYRVRRAMRMLGRGAPSTETAYSCGYADQSHLVKEFRTITGRTPGAFRAGR